MIVGPLEPRPSQELPTCSIYQFDNCPLSVFRKCLVESDWSHLVKGGEATPEVIEDAGLTIWSNWCDARGAQQVSALISRSKSIATLAAKIDRITILIESARYIAHDNIIAALASEGYVAEAERMRSDDDSVYLKALVSIEARLKSDKLRLDMLMSDRDKPKKDNRTPEQRRKEEAEHFTDEIVAVEDSLKMSIDEERVTTEKYCGYIRRIQRQIEHMNKQTRKKHG